MNAPLQVTNVRIFPNTNPKVDDKLKAYVCITLNDGFTVRDLKIIQGKDRCFVAMPSKRHPTTGEFLDVAHPVDPKHRDLIEEKILAVWDTLAT